MTGEEMAALVLAELRPARNPGAGKRAAVGMVLVRRAGRPRGRDARPAWRGHVSVPPPQWLAALALARDGLDCDFFDWLTAVDEQDEGFAVVVHVYSLAGRHHVCLRTLLPARPRGCRPRPGSTGGRPGTSGRPGRCSAWSSRAIRGWPRCCCRTVSRGTRCARISCSPRGPPRSGRGRRSPGSRPAGPGPPAAAAGGAGPRMAGRARDGNAGAEDLPARSRGVIALLEENCTVCMLCARECPDWCIYIESHKEPVPGPRRGGAAGARGTGSPGRGPAAGAQRAGPVRDRLLAVHVLRHLRGGLPVRRAVLVARIRVRRDHIAELTHERDRLRGWMSTVPPPPAHDPGAPTPREVQAVPGGGAAEPRSGAAGAPRASGS